MKVKLIEPALFRLALIFIVFLNNAYAQIQSPANDLKEKRLPMTRTTPPRIATPVEHQSVRYQQDASNAADKEHGAIYLAAHDSASDALLWRVKITDPIRHAANSPTGNSIRPINLTRIAVGPNEGQLTIETEFGARYLVDLVEKRSTCIFNPDDQAPPKAAGTQPPLPPPLPPTGR